MMKSEVKIIVVKIGGSTLGSHDTTLDDLVSLQEEGSLSIVVHGGGSKINEWLKKIGGSTAFVRGMRVTNAATLEVVIAVLAGLVNKELVAAIISKGGQAIGLSGADGGLIQGRMEYPDLGYVGKVVKVNAEPVKTILSAGYIPLIAPVGLKAASRDTDPVKLLNINGDVVASEIAGALKVERLIFLTDVPGVRDGQGKFLPRLSAAEARDMIASGFIAGGMIPKVEACLNALSRVSSTQIVDGRSAHALLSAIEGKTVGTRIEQ